MAVMAPTIDRLPFTGDEAPNPVKEALSREDAEALRDQLQEAGATVELK